MSLMSVPEGLVLPAPDTNPPKIHSRGRDGPVHIHREIMAGWLWTEPAGLLKVFLQIVFLAADGPSRERVSGKTFDVPRGSLASTRDWLADQAGMSWPTYKKWLDQLVAREVIRIKLEKRGRVVIRIMNYAKYQQPCQSPEEIPWKSPDKPSRKKRIRSGTYLDELIAGAAQKERRMAVLYREHLGGASSAADPARALDAIQRAGATAWIDADVLLWLGLYASKYRAVYGVLPGELVAAKRAELQRIRPLIGKALKTLRDWAPTRATTAESLMNLYLRWLFKREKETNRIFQEHASKGLARARARAPVTVERAFDIKQVDRWWVSSRLKRDRLGI